MSGLLMQNWPLVTFAAAAAVVLVLALVALREGPLPYERRGVLLTPAEINFLRHLEASVRQDWQVFSMVRLADIIQVRSKTRKSATWQNRIYGKRVDFVLCDYETLEVKLCIELDDPADRSPERKARDKFVNVALAAARLPMLRIRVQDKYENALLRKDLEDALGIVRKKKRA